MLSKKTFSQGIQSLQLAFGTELTHERFTFFFDRIAPHFSDAEFLATVEKIISNERFFPVIAVFFDYNPKRGPVL